MTAPLIRLADPGDVPLLSRLGAATFRETYRPISDPDEVDDYADANFTPDKVRAWLRADPARTLIAFADGAAAGYAHLRRAPVPACVADRQALELSRLYLLASAQGRGLGGALMDAVLAQAVALGAATLWLGAYDRNEKALAFYARRGFERVGTHAFEFGGRIHADPVLTRPLAGNPTIIPASQDNLDTPR